MTTHADRRLYYKDIVLSFMEQACHGYRNALTKEEILTRLNTTKNLTLSERGLRSFMSDLRKEGHVASHTSNPKGYWFIPINTNDPLEIEAVMRSLLDKKARVADMASGIDRELTKYEGRLRVVKDGDLFS